MTLLPELTATPRISRELCFAVRAMFSVATLRAVSSDERRIRSFVYSRSRVSMFPIGLDRSLNVMGIGGFRDGLKAAERRRNPHNPKNAASFRTYSLYA